MPEQILLVDDDTLLLRSLTYLLQSAGFQVRPACSAEAALAAVSQSAPDLVVLDLGLPGMDGMEFLRQFRSQHNTPIVMLTARRRGMDEVLALELGADDYVTKPFDPDVLLVRIRLALRRARGQAGPPRDARYVVAGDLTVDTALRIVTKCGRPVDVTPRAFDLLQVLATEPNRVFSVYELVKRVWGAEYAGEPQVVYVHMRWLRERLEEDPTTPRRLITVHGAGYKLVPQES